MVRVKWSGVQGQMVRGYFLPFKWSGVTFRVNAGQMVRGYFLPFKWSGVTFKGQMVRGYFLPFKWSGVTFQTTNDASRRL
jgi:hypothetical protein